MKYLALKKYLETQRLSRLRLSFQDIERVLGEALPPSASKRPAWWANDAAGHAQAKAWLEAGFKTADVDVEGRAVSFVRLKRRAQAVREKSDSFEHKPAKAKVHPAYGALKGTFKVRDWDVTKPALDPEDLAEWEANIERMADMAYAARGDEAENRPQLHGKRQMQQSLKHDPEQDPKNVKVHPMIGALKGTFTIKGWDVTKPALDEEELAEWEANIERKFDDIAAGLAKPK
jgi:hypothetical protein